MLPRGPDLGGGRGATGRQAGSRLLSLQGRESRGHGGHRRRALSSCRTISSATSRRRRSTALVEAYLPPDDSIGLQSDRDQHRREAHPGRYRQRAGAFKQTNGELANSKTFAAAGIKLTDIDAVIISHFHGDHVNGLLEESNKLAFPNAEVLVPATEWKFWMDDGEMSRALQGPHGRPVQEQSPDIRRAWPQGHAI